MLETIVMALLWLVSLDLELSSIYDKILAILQAVSEHEDDENKLLTYIL